MKDQVNKMLLSIVTLVLIFIYLQWKYEINLSYYLDMTCNGA